MLRYFFLISLCLSITAPHLSVAGDNEAQKNISSYIEDIQTDYRFHYSMKKMIHMGLTLGVGGIMANTNIDHQVRDYYQDDIRNSTTNNISDFFTSVGDVGHMQYSIPIYLGSILIGRYGSDSTLYNKLHDWGWRSIRTLALGAPQHYLLTHALGSGRPEEGNSHWDFFDDNNGASGHTFYGAVPLINAANLAENELLKYSLYAASVFPGLARINDDQHYLSQVVIGWMIAYMAADTVNESESSQNNIYSMIPFIVPGGGGIMVVGEL